MGEAFGIILWWLGIAAVSAILVALFMAYCIHAPVDPEEMRRIDYIDKRVKETNSFFSSRQMGRIRREFGAEYDEIMWQGWQEGFEAGKKVGITEADKQQTE